MYVSVLMMFIRAPLLVPLIPRDGGGDTCFMVNVFQGLQSTKSVPSREIASVKFTKRSKQICSIAVGFSHLSAPDVYVILEGLTRIDFRLCGEGLPGKL